MRRLIHHLPIIALFFILPLILFFQQTIGGKTLLPTDNLYQYEPYATYRDELGVPEIPHNALLSDLVLQNVHWKNFIRQSLNSGEIPLWNPHQLSGVPFLAAGQQSAFYPLGVLYYVLPLASAYGWFMVVNLGLAGVLMYGYALNVGINRLGAIVAGITYQLCGFFIASAVHPMIIGAAVWLPLILWMVEWIISKKLLLNKSASALYVVVGGVAIAFNIFAGHIEMTLYTLLIVGYYSAGRLLYEWLRGKRREALISAGWLMVMAGLGIGLGAIQLIPLYDFVRTNWRSERASLDTVLGYAHPMRDLLLFLMPNFFGNPSHHSYMDIFTGQTVTQFTNLAGTPITTIDWGIKNYVEGAMYIGIFPLILAGIAVLDMFRNRRKDAPPHRLMTTILAGIALTFMFGLPTYALIFALPGFNQLNTPFRWVYAFSFCIALLAGFGMMTISQATHKKMYRRLGGILLFIGGLVIAGVGVGRFAFSTIEPLLTRLIASLEKADGAFSSASMFFSYQAPNVLIFGAMLIASGAILTFIPNEKTRARTVWGVISISMIALDLLIGSWGFNPSSEPEWGEFTPPSVQFLTDKQANGEVFRFTTLENHEGHAPLFRANITWGYGLDDVRGYESIISSQYVAYMRDTNPQYELDFNRVAGLYLYQLNNNEIDWARVNLLNVKYIITHVGYPIPAQPVGTTYMPSFTEIYADDAVRIYDNPDALPRAFLVDDTTDLPTIETAQPATITADTGREKFVDVTITDDTWLIISESYADGWRAFIRPQGAGDDQEQPLPVQLVYGNFQGIQFNSAEIRDLFPDTENFTLRIVYSPTSFQVGLFGSVMSAGMVMFLTGVWIWGAMTGGSKADEGSTFNRVARNSIAPILLNLFNRGIDFAFAFVMLRVLGPEQAGIYSYAVVVFVWFDIFSNFGLDLFLIREASRQRDRAGYLFINTSMIRAILVVAGIPLLIGFLFIRQATVTPQLNADALWAMGLLYIGLAPASISKGLTSLYYAFERAEYPAAVATIATLNKAVFGVIVLLLGYGIIGLAGVSIGINIITLGILWLGSRQFLRGQTLPSRPDTKLMGGMMRQSYPLMFNHLLATIFFQIDIILLEAIKGARLVGQYSVAYRWMMALNVIPAFFTQALLPIMSRQAQSDKDALKRTYSLGVKLLVMLAVPLAVIFTMLADSLTLLLGGAEYMPVGAITLQIMIWSIPIGWINSLTQYALIAVDLQKRITGAFVVAVSFNIITNLIFIPQYGYQAAAVTTILSEAVLLVPFGLLLQTALGRLNWVDMVWRSIVMGAMMLAVMLGLWGMSSLLALVMSIAVYAGGIVLLRPFNADEQQMLAPITRRFSRKSV
ncbi:MAG: oligosaccharide flippase family protein [Anaerolineae bacterium]|nr:oligosaccharide flippase family protein [Anaerolineae bacterium]